MSPAEQAELDKFLTEHTAKGYLVPSKSPMALPVFFIKKKDGKLRLVQTDLIKSPLRIGIHSP